jgi:hypothetical protein
LHRFIVTIEGQGWTEVDEMELPSLPEVGAPLETKVGTCIVTQADLTPEGEQHKHDGTIVCRLP